MKKSLLIAALLSFAAAPALGSDWEDLAKDGWAVVQSTQVDGDFEGCEYDKRIPLMNGLIFVCQEYGYSYSYMADVYILQNVRGNYGYKVVIDDEEYDGTLYKR